jgi:choline kinase
MPTLVILAAGMASRYGSRKQTAGFGPYNETIMEYSVYDAIQAGFKKVVFIIRKEFYEDFKAAIEPKIKGKIAIDYCFQELDKHVGNAVIHPERKKPWGTTHAVLCASEYVQEPFVTINADDFYGREAFETAVNYFNTSPNKMGIVAYVLKNTISDNGTVNRGVCKVANGYLQNVVECEKIGENAEGQLQYVENNIAKPLDENSPVSMNFWCFDKKIFQHAKTEFDSFIQNEGNKLTSECLLPSLVDDLIKSETEKFTALTCNAKWFGVTYQADADGVRKNLAKLTQQGLYPSPLWA